ncbi:T9SS type A sorting domain-containing protein [Bacteroidia bacterium]|nr:T9SS type A sorting domain-containing protein [Bacteroidia bacterium]MDB4107459.1 T9SS type A sorting domain-containing protein [Bacteroidia bacterium]MDB9881632.1 T9SS type A sorting domain-containing protein [Bacteroidia bacterium]
MTIFRYFFSTVVLVSSFAANAQKWTPHQSPQQINDLVDNGTELIMATDYGLVVMNKSTLSKTTYTTNNSDLDDNHISSITKAPNGDIYFSTGQTIGTFDGTDVNDVEIASAVIANINTFEIFDVEVAANGDLWLGNSDGVLRKQGQNWTKYDKTELGEFFEVWDIELDSEEDVFIGAQNGVHKFESGTWSKISENTSLQGYLHAELFFSKFGDLYFAGDLDSIGRYDGTNWELYSNGGLNGSAIKGFAEDDNVYFLSQQDGIYKLDNGTFTTYTDAQTAAFQDNSSYFYVDDSNKRWLNYNIYLSVNDEGTIRSTSISSNGIEYNNVSEIHKSQNGDILFGMTSSTQSIAVLDPDGNWSSIDLPAGMKYYPGSGNILSVGNDDIWLSSYQGVHHYDGTDWTFTELARCTYLANDSKGIIYAAGFDRLYVLEDGDTTQYTTSNSPISGLDQISGLGVDANDNLWIASFSWSGEAAIQKVDDTGNWTTYDHTKHAEIDQPKGEFHFDENGNVWISAKVGAIKFDGKKFTNPIKENISKIDNYKALSIESDSEGRMYFAHQYGVTTLLDSVWGELLIDDVSHKKTSARSSITFDDAGTLWWASNDLGVFSYTPETIASIFSSIESTNDISIYPNPTKGTINFRTKHIGKSSVNIYNGIGELVYTNDNLNTNRPLHLNQSPGMYVVVLDTNNSTSVQKLIIK